MVSPYLSQCWTIRSVLSLPISRKSIMRRKVWRSISRSFQRMIFVRKRIWRLPQAELHMTCILQVLMRRTTGSIMDGQRTCSRILIRWRMSRRHPWILMITSQVSWIPYLIRRQATCMRFRSLARQASSCTIRNFWRMPTLRCRTIRHGTISMRSQWR